MVDFLLVLIELCSQLSRLRQYERILVEIIVFEMGMGHVECKFQGMGGGMLTNGCWHQKTSPWAIMWHCLPDSAFSRFGTIPANGHMTANTRGSIVLHG